ncbi:MAG: hypothetical protein COT73_01090 [Bdellovibrio sp. CG10_big_fil_rev_8_21_14_0_10_47_8]|nr:MAG: hypothetical protein COT73_01090 [Bdellovibrio sp. CG10_big_fil_rev_8_21_14_0_10_47_8]
MKITKKRNRYRNYLSLEALVILLVMGIFRLVPDVKWASVVAGFLFIGSSLGILYWETRYPDFKKHASFWGVLVFFIFSALPIFILRLWHWDIAFDQVQFLGFSGPELHKTSNNIFILMMVCFFADSYLESKREQEQAQ